MCIFLFKQTTSIVVFLNLFFNTSANHLYFCVYINSNVCVNCFTHFIDMFYDEIV